MRARYFACSLTISLLSACATSDYRIVESQSGDEIRISTLAEGLADQG